MMEQTEIVGVTSMEKYLTRRQVADLFGVNVVTVGRWIKAGKLRAGTNGHRWYISPAAVRDFASALEKGSRGCLTPTPAKRGGPGPVRRARYEAQHQANAS